jgi:transposase
LIVIEEALQGEERVIRKQELKQPLFYDAQQISPPAAGNFHLRLDEAVKDWEALAQPYGAAFSAEAGQPTDPVVYLKIFLIGYLENITYDTDLAERIADSLAIRQFLGYALTELPPDHSSISRNRALIGQHCCVEQVLERVVALCIEQGLVEGKEAAVDSTLIPANASLSSLRSIKTGKGVREHLAEVRERNKTAERPEKATISNEEFRSGTDPDARISKKPGTPRGMYYKVSHVTDGANGIILAAGCERADVGDTEAAKPVLQQSQRTLAQHDLSLGTVVADAGYDGADFQAAVEEMGTTPLTNYKQDTTDKAEGFKKADFQYDAECDCYRCPAGKRLRYHHASRRDGRIYQREQADCEGCPHRAGCIGSAGARRIARGVHEASRERNIARCHTEEGRQALRRRRHIVEPPFRHMKTYGGLGRINCRGRTKVKVKVLLAAVAWNLIKLVGALARSAEPGLARLSDFAASACVLSCWLARATQALRAFLCQIPHPFPSRLTSPAYQCHNLLKVAVLR